VPKQDAKWRKSAKSFGLRFHQVSYRDFQLSKHQNLPNPPNLPNFPNLRIDYPKPETIGADRLADAAGAVSRYGAPVLVMDFGTALTAAVVTKDRVWRGGVIAPGFPLMRDYLFERTAKLPRMRIGSGKAPRIGRSTEEAMRFGALVGYRGMVREIVSELRRNFKCDFKLVATGGFAKWVLKDLDLPFVIDPTLTLYGAGLVCAKSF
jgi:type III pantothenate kinase